MLVSWESRAFLRGVANLYVDIEGRGQRVRIGATTCFVPMSPSVHVLEEHGRIGGLNARTRVSSTAQFQVCGIHIEE
jgi:hypothetical protein